MTEDDGRLLSRIIRAAANEGRNFDARLTDDQAAAVEAFASYLIGNFASYLPRAADLPSHTASLARCRKCDQPIIGQVFSSTTRRWDHPFTCPACKAIERDGLMPDD